MCYALRTGQTSSSLTLGMQSHMCRKPCGPLIVETQKERGRAPVKRTLITVELTLL